MGLFASRETGLRWFGCGLGWFGANMTGLRNKNAFKFILQVFILSQKHILGVKKVVWCGLDVVWGVSTDRAVTLKCVKDSFSRKGLLFAKRSFIFAKRTLIMAKTIH